MPKGTSWAEVTSNGEKIKPAIIKLCWSGNIRKLVSQSVENSVE